MKTNKEKKYQVIGIMFLIVAAFCGIFGFGFARQAGLSLGVQRLISFLGFGIPGVAGIYFLYVKCDSWMN